VLSLACAVLQSAVLYSWRADTTQEVTTDDESRGAATDGCSEEGDECGTTGEATSSIT